MHRVLLARRPPRRRKQQGPPPQLRLRTRHLPPAGAARRQRPEKACPFYYQLDHLGTPQELTDYSGEIVWSAQYDAYGKVAAITLAGEDYRPAAALSGQYFDAESGLHYNRHRYYDPRLGRYLTPDPIKLAVG
jgi:RHS repeat-associated protein